MCSSQCFSPSTQFTIQRPYMTPCASHTCALSLCAFLLFSHLAPIKGYISAVTLILLHCQFASRVMGLSCTVGRLQEAARRKKESGSPQWAPFIWNWWQTEQEVRFNKVAGCLHYRTLLPMGTNPAVILFNLSLWGSFIYFYLRLILGF